MTRYKRTLYIGIGGAGIDTLRFVKKKLREAVENENGKGAELPDQVKFLCIDTNTTSLANLEDFNDDEKMCVSVRDPYGRYDREKTSSTYEYIPEVNSQHISALDRGAGQVRSNGHFAIIESEFLGNMTRKLRSIANDIRVVTIPDETMLVDTKIEVHMAFSLSGGTGSGMFLPVSALVREAIKNCEITGYMYSPAFFDHLVEDSAKEMVVQNAYAAIAELDYCMHYGAPRHIPVTYSFGPTRNNKITLKKRPFDEVMFIDKQTFVGANGTMEYTYLDKTDAQELTAELLLLSSTDALTAHIGVMDNVRKKVAQGQFNVRDKFGWVMGFGLSELFIQGKDTLNKTAIEKGIEYLSAYTSVRDNFEPESIAYNWLNDLKLNETGDAGDNNDLIEDLYRLEERTQGFTLDKMSAKPSIDEWYQMVEGTDATVERQRKDALKLKIESSIGTDYSFSELVDILDKLKDMIQASYNQLEKEKKSVDKSLNDLGIIDYSNEPQKTIKKKGLFGISTTKENPNYKGDKAAFEADKINKLQKYAKFKADSVRKGVACTILANIKGIITTNIERYRSRVKKAERTIIFGEEKLKPYTETTTTEPSKKHARNRINVTSSTYSLVVSNPILVDWLEEHLDDNNCSEETLFKKVEDLIVARMSGNVVNSGKSQLLSIINGLPDNSSVLRDLLKNSAPLLSLDFHGESLSVDEFTYIVGEDAVANALKVKLEKMYPRKFEIVPIDSMPYSVMLYRIVGAVPPYFVNGIAGNNDPLSMEHTYEVAKTHKMDYTPFAHSMLQKQLENKFAVLKPYDELEDGKVMDTWINFILLGYIHRSTSGRYWIPSTSCGERISDNLESRDMILKLGDDRASSFETFRRHCSELLEEKSIQYMQTLEKIADEPTAYIIDGKPNITTDYYFNKGEELASDQRGRSLTSKQERNKLRPGDADFTLFEKEIAHIDRRAHEYDTRTKVRSLDDEILDQNSKLSKG